MELNKCIPLLTTDRLDELKAYYVANFDFRVTFESDGFLGLKAPGPGEAEISFMKPGDCFGPPFAGGGLLLCLEVEDVDGEYERLLGRGLTMVQSPQDNPWGDRSTMTIDPVGVGLYIYKPIPMADEFKDCVKE